MTLRTDHDAALDTILSKGGNYNGQYMTGLFIIDGSLTL